MTDRDDAVPTAPSLNAVTHGLTARRPLCEQEAERFRVLVDTWTMKHRPETEIELLKKKMAHHEAPVILATH